MQPWITLNSSYSDGIPIALDRVGGTPDNVARMTDLIATHLDRIAFREAPLAFR